MTTTFITTIVIEPGYDHRDIPGGEVNPLGLVFKLDGPDGRVISVVNTGWVRRPLTTDRLRVGSRQERASRPGVDHALATRFPIPIGVAVMRSGAIAADEAEEIHGYSDEVMEAMFEAGDEGVFRVLTEVYLRFLQG
ncbi:hypothetical protein [Microbacterium ureisolvens]|uniref:Uncharacterized protein n=1 Tax=Microbacterium ureisolvens TaxID=2781186 RepID=A0ABS7HXQ1_9MICO|nr:hypothetical protein [Microbacterium ureisolvens]MBW9110152.1 hypothetical protein [Microbacterium ureisolvens]